MNVLKDSFSGNILQKIREKTNIQMARDRGIVGKENNQNLDTIEK
ncbi:hypothetical protein [Wolbachia endosymbiont of Dirofilaria (Dirofilaria) immitis]|nr:hypothetical protein [Wolbachia endosymbiont of Dirofilaria (Dirofilaria) immitis]